VRARRRVVTPLRRSEAPDPATAAGEAIRADLQPLVGQDIVIALHTQSIKNNRFDEPMPQRLDNEVDVLIDRITDDDNATGGWRGRGGVTSRRSFLLCE
jgi:hypothetical protein